MTNLNLQFNFNVPRQVIYEALTDQFKIMSYTRAPAKIQSHEGGEFSLLQGKIQGKFLKLRVGEYIKMQWRLNDWKTNSIVQIILQDPEEDQCDVIINQNGIPIGEKKQKIQFGWKEYYFGAMNKILGYPFRD